MPTEPSPPPVPSGPPPMPAPGPRPGPVTAAGTLMIIVGALVTLGGLLAMFGGGALVTQFQAVGGIVVVPVGILAIFTGTRILGLSSTWRVFGLVLAAIGGLLSLFVLLQRDADILEGLGSLAIYGFVIWALVRYAPAFTR